jgi:hypothetical protein
MSLRVVILGSGYTGRYLYQAAQAHTNQVWATSRQPERNLPYVHHECRLIFDLMHPETWAGLPTDCRILWCFPAQPPEVVRRFIENRQSSIRRLVVLGSTSAYRTPCHEPNVPPWLDERAPIDLSLPRVQGEEYLRRHCGAVVLRVAGIYGPGRNPLDWIRNRRIGPSRRYVNLIHVEDLAAISLELLCDNDTPGEIYNVSDGIPRTWDEICRTARARWHVVSSESRNTNDAGKRIDTGKLRRRLRHCFRYPDLYDALARIESPPEPSRQIADAPRP